MSQPYQKRDWALTKNNTITIDDDVSISKSLCRVDDSDIGPSSPKKSKKEKKSKKKKKKKSKRKEEEYEDDGELDGDEDSLLGGEDEDDFSEGEALDYLDELEARIERKKQKRKSDE